ncbi:AAA family ATPase [Wukongibacter baidiensis]|uniref:AAA family ATPase n=1 Tax=Wukongibacter baidiensis TaxID=1723361 RepID=UPI003D7FC479
MAIEVKLLGTPSVMVDGRIIEFPYKKTEALFYYLVVNKKVLRDKVSWLLWGNRSDCDAKKNLRNAIYILKKTLPVQCINIVNRSIVALDSNIEIKADVYELMEMDNEIHETFGEEFLSGFSLKESEEFEEWVGEKKLFYGQCYLDKLNNAIERGIESCDFTSIERYLKMLIKKDEYNEEAYRRLMGLYYDNGKIGKLVELYEFLENKFSKELGIKPDPLTRDLYNKIYDNELNNRHENISRTDCYEREKEIKIFNNRFKTFLNKRTAGCLMVYGEAGAGKTTLISSFMEKHSNKCITVLKTECFQAVQDYVLEPWNAILEQLIENINIDEIDISDLKKQILGCFFPTLFDNKKLDLDVLLSNEKFKVQFVVEIVSELITKIAKKHPIIITIEDIQWCDKVSIELFIKILTDGRNLPILIVGTSRNIGKKRIDNHMYQIQKLNLLTEVKLDRFSEKSVFRLCKVMMPDLKLKDKVIREVYKETEGNAFFLVEAIALLKEGKDFKSLSLKMKGILENRLASISEDARRLLNILSIFFDETTFDTLLCVSEESPNRLVDMIEELREKNIVRELINHKGQISYRFSHKKLRDYVYSQLSLSRSKILNNQVATCLESYYKKDMYDSKLLKRLIYYFSKSRNLEKQLKYMIESVEVYLNLSHELFPLINDRTLQAISKNRLSLEYAEKTFDEIENLITEIKRTKGNSKELEGKERKYLTMKSNYLIWQGEYERGVGLLEIILNNTKEDDDINITIQGLQQMCYYGIQTDNENILDKYGNSMYDLCFKYNIKEGIGTSLRFLGILYILKRDYKKAHDYLMNSITIFKDMEDINNKYTLSIVAAKNFIANIYNYSERTQDALELYEKCIDICESKNIYWGLDLIYANAGHSAFETGDLERARNYFENSLRVYNDFTEGKGYIIASSFMALFNVYEKRYKEALIALKNADRQAEKLQKKYWIGITLRIKTEIKLMMNSDGELRKAFEEYLDDDLEVYRKRALAIFRDLGCNNEVKMLENIA